LTIGKARFWVIKLLDFKRSEFRVKTPTAVCGVRASDFITEVARFLDTVRTQVTALEDTLLEVVSLAAPEVLMLLSDYERTDVLEGHPPSEKEKVPIEEIMEMMRELAITPAEGEPEAEAGVDQVKEERPILVAHDELVEPADLGEPDIPGAVPGLDVMEVPRTLQTIADEEQYGQQQAELYGQQQQEDQTRGILQEGLPSFPETPE
jgi:hypothetical protein